MSQEIKSKIESLRNKIREHDYLYYVLSQPTVSDKEYDRLMAELKSLEEKFPQFKSAESPTVRVSGGVLDGFKTIKHIQKMASLDNTYSIDELKLWDERVHKGLKDAGDIEYVAELKIDGVSASLTYRQGSLISGVTRGDGETGEDVTSNIKTIRAIPLALRGKGVPLLIEVRGEVYLSRKEFEAINREREDAGDVLFANPRNAASGTLKLLDSALVSKRKLAFFAHSLGSHEDSRLNSQWDFLSQLKDWGIAINPGSRLCRSLNEVIAYCNEWQEKRDKLSYEIDGVVVKVNSLAQQERLGSTMKSPRWAVAYKFPARQATTEVLKIQVNVGRTGVITPVAELKPVECSGVVIKHATLHNFDEIERLGVKEGDRVLIERAGDVIPKVVKVVEHKGKHKFIIPKHCPSCQGRVVREKEEDVAYRCINSSCPAQLERGLEHFAARDAMDVEGMGEAVVSQLVGLKLVKSFSDIFKLKEADLLKLELFKHKKARNLLSAIEKSKNRSLSRLIFALGIRHVGQKAALVLAQRFTTMDKLMNASPEELDSIYEVGPALSTSITDYFSLPQTKELISELRNAGLNFKEQAAKVKQSKLSGKVIVFTGELRGFSRAQAEALVRGRGGNPVSSVSKSTDFVVVGEAPGSKYEKAKQLGVKIITEKQFEELL